MSRARAAARASASAAAASAANSWRAISFAAKPLRQWASRKPGSAVRLSAMRSPQSARWPRTASTALSKWSSAAWLATVTARPRLSYRLAMAIVLRAQAHEETLDRIPVLLGTLGVAVDSQGRGAVDSGDARDELALDAGGRGVDQRLGGGDLAR